MIDRRYSIRNFSAESWKPGNVQNCHINAICKTKKLKIQMFIDRGRDELYTHKQTHAQNISEHWSDLTTAMFINMNKFLGKTVSGGAWVA